MSRSLANKEYRQASLPLYCCKHWNRKCGFQGDYIRLDINAPQLAAATPTSKSSRSPSLTADPKDISITEQPEENDLVREKKLECKVMCVDVSLDLTTIARPLSRQGGGRRGRGAYFLPYKTISICTHKEL